MTVARRAGCVPDSGRMAGLDPILPGSIMDR
jgi:hypothetical protein